jgi:hypothetical protein
MPQVRSLLRNCRSCDVTEVGRTSSASRELRSRLASGAAAQIKAYVVRQLSRLLLISLQKSPIAVTVPLSSLVCFFAMFAKSRALLEGRHPVSHTDFQFD